MTPVTTMTSMLLRHSALPVAIATLTFALGCKRETRQFDAKSPAAPAYAAVTLDTLQPGVPAPDLALKSPAEGNAYDISEGKRLFEQWNCSGCHSHGGGGMGPPLMDNEWIYGSAPENIVATIVEGRPNGMPSFRGRIRSQQLWQLAAYVRSLSGLQTKASSSGRDDHMQVKMDESRTPIRTPRASASKNLPAGAVRP